MPLRIYNTMSRRKETFEPLGKEVLMYVCGPTVYDRMHIGHARTFIFFDTVAKYLRYRGYAVRFVMNITDVDDKIIKRGMEEGVTAQEIAERYASLFLNDMKKLGITSVTLYPRATQHIREMIDIVTRLVSAGYAYSVDGDVFFDVSTAHDYGRLSNQSQESIIAGARVEVDSRKKNPADFALWKSAKPGEISWPSPWGRGRPGWHIECSAMSLKHLGETIDIHGGAEDLIFPHHENEIQQSESYTGKKFVRIWMHGGLLNISGQKMSKSLKNFLTVEELLEKYTAQALRYFCSNSTYRKQIDFSLELLEESEAGRRSVIKALQRLHDAPDGQGGEGLAEKLEEDFISAMDDDFNTRGAIAALQSDIRDAARMAEEGRLSGKERERFLQAVMKLNDVLGILPDVLAEDSGEDAAEASELLMKREEARARKDFASADELRRKIEALGYTVEDTQKGPRLKKIIHG